MKLHWLLVLAILVTCTAAEAQIRGLVRVADVPGLYWVDDFGIKHYVPDMRTAHALFGPEVPIATLNAVDWLAMPRGQGLTIGMDPRVFNVERDIMAKADRIPQGYLRYERIETGLGAAPIKPGLATQPGKLFDNDTDMGRPLMSEDLESETDVISDY